MGSSLVHFLQLRAGIVVFVQYILGDICSVGDDFFRESFSEEVGYTASADGVWTNCVLASVGLLAVGVTVAVG